MNSKGEEAGTWLKYVDFCVVFQDQPKAFKKDLSGRSRGKSCPSHTRFVHSQFLAGSEMSWSQGPGPLAGHACTHSYIPSLGRGPPQGLVSAEGRKPEDSQSFMLFYS